MWKLVIEDDEGKRTVVPLTRDDYTVGRKEGNTIRLTERNVSRDHAKLSRRANGAPPTTAEKGTYVLEDLTSYNGVYVNGLRVAHAQELQHGDLVQIGDYRIILQDDAISDAPATAVPVTDAKSTIPTGAHARASMLMERPNRLVMLAGPTPGAEYPLDSERMTIGRAEDASISVNHNSVSRLHCEVHALGDGRFEIVDKGSSNGVRVNSAELRRGIIEAGDVIELGDVKFKFVGAGQIFRPGATESQQLAAIGERTAAEIVGKRRSNAVPAILFGVLVAAGAASAWFVTRPKPDPSPAPPVSGATADDADMQIIKEAQKSCTVKDCETGHLKVTKELPDGSPLRKTAEFKDIEAKWAKSMFAKADEESDPEKKRAILEQIEKTGTVDQDLRKKASSMLQSLDQASTPEQLPPVIKDAGAIHDAGWKFPDAGRLKVWDAAAPTASNTTSATATTSAPTAATTDPLANANAYRKSLEGKVFGGRASTEEIMILRSMCRGQNDRTCVATCNQMLGAQQPKPPAP